jgi:hypothetical protein
MQTTARVAVLVAVVTACVLAAAPAALACTCGPPPTVPVALERAAVVFEGTVVAGPTDADDRTVEYRFEVLRSWKGSPGDQVTIRTAPHSAACGRSFEKGSTWLLFPYSNEDGALFDNICSRSGRSKGAEADLAELGEATPAGTSTPAAEVTDPADDGTATETAPTTDEPAPAEEDDELEKKPGCSVAGGGASPWLLLLPLAGLLRRRS